MATPIEKMSAGVRSAMETRIGVESTNKVIANAKQAGGGLKFALKEIAGPLALATGAALGLLGTFTKIHGIVKQISLREFERVSQYAPQFQRLLGSLDAAKRRIQEISRFTARGPFAFGDAVEANRRLQILTRGTLATSKGMRLVADVAASTNNSMANTAGVVGELYDSLENGRAIEGSVSALRDLGAISTDAANRILYLSQRGGRFKEVWSLARQELERNNGAADSLKGTIAGLAATLSNAKADQLQGIGAMFEAGQVAGLKTGIQAVETFGPVLKDVIAPLAVVSNAFAELTGFVVRAATSIPGLRSALVGVAQAGLIFVGILASIGAAQIGKFLLTTVGILIRFSKSSMAAAAAGTGLARVFGIIGSGVLRALGPLALLAALLDSMGGGLSEVARKWGVLGDVQSDATSKIRETNQAIQEQIGGAGGTTATKTDAMAKATDNYAEAVANRQQAEKEAAEEQASNKNWLGRTFGGAVQGGIGGALLTKNPWGIAGGAVLGGLGAAFLGGSSEKQRALQAAINAENEAKGVRDAARAFKPADAAKYLKDPDYAAVVGRGEVASPENLESERARRLAASQVQLQSLRSIVSATGDPTMRKQADDIEDALLKDQQRREYLSKKFSPADAESMATADVLAQQLDRNLERNPIGTSGLGRVGGAGGEAYGGSSEETRALTRILEEIRQIKTGTARQYQIPDELK